MMQGVRKGSAVVVVKDGRLLMIKSAKEATYEKWVIPGGKIEEGETPQEAGKRELAEELGLEVEVTEELCARPIPGKEDRFVQFSRGIYKSGELTPSSDEVLDAAYLTRAEIAELEKTDQLTPTMVDVLSELGWLGGKER